MLQRHISTRHALNKDEYLKRWGLRSDHPLTASAYSERRSTLAKALGLGRKPNAAVLPAVTPRPAPTPVDVVKDSQATPARRRSRAASKSADLASDAVAEPTPKRRWRSRSASKSLTVDGANEAVAEPKSPARKGRPQNPDREPSFGSGASGATGSGQCALGDMVEGREFQRQRVTRLHPHVFTMVTRSFDF
jgi:hypothetical protein